MRFIYLLELQKKRLLFSSFNSNRVGSPSVTVSSGTLQAWGRGGVTCDRNRVSYHVFRGVFSDEGL